MNAITTSGPAARPAPVSGFRAVLAASVAAIALAGCSVTPEPFTMDDHARRAQQDIAALRTVPEPVAGPVSLHEAIARAIKYNLDNRLKVMEAAFAERQLTMANLSMLPKLAANAGYEGRSNAQASSSRNVYTQVQSLATSTSSDREGVTAELGPTWNILDFGMSYVRANQAADRTLIVQERRRKVVHNIVQDVRAAYWQAASADRLLKRIDPLITRIDEALDNARSIERQALKPPREALEYRRDLLRALNDIKTLRRELISGKANLAALMGLPPGEDFTVAIDGISLDEPKVSVTLDQIEQSALLYRPELREEAYQARIGAGEVKAAMLSLIPGVSLGAGYNYDSNSFAYKSNWISWSAKVNHNLFDTFLNGPARIDEAHAIEDVARTRRLAVSMAVLTQAHVSWLAYKQAVSEFRTAREMNEVETAMLEQIRASNASGRGNELEVINAEVEAVLAELRRDVAFAQMTNAVGRIYVTAGADPLPDKVEAHDIKTLAKAVAATMERWSAGQLAPAEVRPVADAAPSAPAPAQPPRPAVTVAPPTARAEPAPAPAAVPVNMTADAAMRWWEHPVSAWSPAVETR